MNNTILNLMVNQHGLIEALFFVFKDEVSSKSERVKKAFSDLSWELKKHFFVEEEAIFNFLAWKSAEISEVVSKLKADHILILGKIDYIEKNIDKISTDDVQNLYEVIKAHREIEEKEAYPLIDQTLSDTQKEKIFKRVNEIPIKK